MALSNQIIYPIFAFLILFLMLVFVPRQEIKKLFWFSMLWGSGGDLFIIQLFKLLNLYRYIVNPPFNFYGAPMWITIAWTPAVVMFIHFLPRRKEWYVFPIYLTSFSMLGVYIGIFFHQAGLIQPVHWHDLLRFPVQFIWLYGAAKHYNALKASDKDTI